MKTSDQRAIEIDKFVERFQIDPRYLIRPTYLRAGGGEVEHVAFAVMSETIRDLDKIAIWQVEVRPMGGIPASPEPPRLGAPSGRVRACPPRGDLASRNA